MFLMELVRWLSSQLTTACNVGPGVCCTLPASACTSLHKRKHYKFKNVFKLIKKKISIRNKTDPQLSYSEHFFIQLSVLISC